MAHVKVKALTNTAGADGMKHTGDEYTMEEIHANELEKKGVVKIVGKVSEAEVKAAAEKKAANMSTFTSITTAEKQYAQPAGVTDPKNPTQDIKPASKAGKKK